MQTPRGKELLALKAWKVDCREQLENPQEESTEAVQRGLLKGGAELQ